MSWLFSRALVEAYSEESCSDGELSALLSGNPMPQAYLCNDKMMGFSRLSRFGMTFKLLTESRGEALLTLYLGDFHARTLAQQEKVQESTANDQACGEKWRGSWVKYDHATSSWKTHQCSLLGDLEPFSETWPSWGLMRDGECWEQPTLALRIRGTESGLWRTPQAADAKSSIVQKGYATNLTHQVMKWPTPTAHNAKETNALSEYSRDTPSLTATIHMRMWGTPKAQDSRHAMTDRGKSNLGEQIAGLHGGKLNPTWVEWLMGWPLGWTDLKPLETDKFRQWQQQHGNS